MIFAEPKCSIRKCKHFSGAVESTDRVIRPACIAFPKGIPSDIAFGDNLHLAPVEGDNGIQFKPEA